MTALHEGARCIRVFDTTLRDGEQAPGCTMTLNEKLEVARQLVRLGVDVIEAGFPASSAGERESVAAIAEAVGRADGPIICGLARASAGDIEACAGSIASARNRRIHTFIATSDLHLRHKLCMSRADVIDRVRDAVTHARRLADDVEFSPEDATRSDASYLCEVLEVAMEAGATTLNIPDTVGYTTPEEYGVLIGRIVALAASRPDVVVSTHCHDDLGLAVANSLAAIRAGARQVECTINGLGERAGNASLEEVVMALRTRAMLFAADTRVNGRELARTSRLVSSCTGVHMPPNKAVVGANAFAHEAGIHQDGMLKYRATYEIMTPESVGADGSTLVLGKHSGRRALQHRLQARGYRLDEHELQAVFERFKSLADRKKTVDDRDLEVLVLAEVERPAKPYVLAQVQASCGTHAIPTATVRLHAPDGAVRTASATGTGPVEAACRAVNELLGDLGELIEFKVHAVTEGLSAVGEVTVRVREHHSGRIFVGRSAHPDIVAASTEAYLAALNWLLSAAPPPAGIPARTEERRAIESVGAIA